MKQQKRKLNIFRIITFIWLTVLTIFLVCGIIKVDEVEELEPIPVYDLGNFNIEELEVM